MHHAPPFKIFEEPMDLALPRLFLCTWIWSTNGFPSIRTPHPGAGTRTMPGFPFWRSTYFRPRAVYRAYIGDCLPKRPSF